VEYKSFTTRLPLEVYEAVRAYKANIEDVSVNQFLVDAVEEKLARSKDEELKRMFADIAEGFDMAEVEPWLEAQKEAMKHIDD